MKRLNKFSAAFSAPYLQNKHRSGKRNDIFVVVFPNKKKDIFFLFQTLRAASTFENWLGHERKPYSSLDRARIGPSVLALIFVVITWECLVCTFGLTTLLGCNFMKKEICERWKSDVGRLSFAIGGSNLRSKTPSPSSVDVHKTEKKTIVFGPESRKKKHFNQASSKNVWERTLVKYFLSFKSTQVP